MASKITNKTVVRTLFELAKHLIFVISHNVMLKLTLEIIDLICHNYYID